MKRISDKDKIKEKLKTDKIVADYSEDELAYLKKPLGKAHYKYSYSESSSESSEEEQLPLRSDRNMKKIPKWKEKVKCDICGGMYMRSSRTRHNRTQRHKIYASVNTKIANLLIDGIDN